MTLEEKLEELKAATDLMFMHALAGRGGSGGQIACARIILALADDQPCDLSVLSNLHGKTADAAGTLIDAYIRYGRSAVFDSKEQQIFQIKAAFA